MNNDLISREALKKALSDKNLITWTHEYGDAIPFDWLMSAIDNAPTVEPKLKDDIVEAFNLITDQEFEHSDSFWIVTPKGKKIEFEKKRPQGEWIYNDYGNGCGNWHCSKCDHIPYYATKYMRFLNFCPNCGADMRGEQE